MLDLNDPRYALTDALLVEVLQGNINAKIELDAILSDIEQAQRAKALDLSYIVIADTGH